jgi:hypothetical protein
MHRVKFRSCVPKNQSSGFSRVGSNLLNNPQKPAATPLAKERVLAHQSDFRAMDESRTAIIGYIDWFHNPTGKHQKLSYISPIQFEQRNRPA